MPRESVQCKRISAKAGVSLVEQVFKTDIGYVLKKMYCKVPHCTLKSGPTSKPCVWTSVRDRNDANPIPCCGVIVWFVCSKESGCELQTKYCTVHESSLKIGRASCWRKKTSTVLYMPTSGVLLSHRQSNNNPKGKRDVLGCRIENKSCKRIVKNCQPIAH